MPEPAKRYPGRQDIHRAWLPVSAQSWRRSGCRCDGCHIAEGRRRYQELAAATQPIQVYRRQYSVQERLAIGTAIGAPGGLATAREVRAWADDQLDGVATAAAWELYEALGAEAERLAVEAGRLA